MGLQCAAAQFQNDMQLPLGIPGDPNSSSWFHSSSNSDGQQTMMLPDEAGLQRYPGYFSMSKQSTETGGEQHQHQQQAAVAAQHQPEFSQQAADCLTSLHLTGQFPYQSSFDHTSLLNDRLFRPDMELHVDNASAAMDFGGHYNHLPRPGDEASFQNWASATCGVTMYDHQQQPASAQLIVQNMTESLTVGSIQQQL
ncbi:hypothetical protein BRADI_4g11094v3 [Brachypodium distachyon]|nr:hypothetical protein BRADI_4g11094v3 [Brachypodium distachyon]PNT63072.1 hypothetical protein BRADI_4g11094v3 [Brachypodium distachyon]